MKQTDYIEKSYIDSYTIKCYVVRKLKLSTVRLMPIHYLYPDINGSCVILLNCERGKLVRRTQGQKVVQTAVFQEIAEWFGVEVTVWFWAGGLWCGGDCSR